MKRTKKVDPLTIGARTSGRKLSENDKREVLLTGKYIQYTSITNRAKVNTQTVKNTRKLGMKAPLLPSYKFILSIF